jgi:hypothetical protein
MKKYQFPEGTYTIQDWISRYADSVESYVKPATFNKRHFNQLNGEHLIH